MQIRNAEASDYLGIISVLDAWWGGRHMADMLPKLFFVHFRETSFVAEVEGEVAGFLIGFLSPTFADEAYIHFVGVNPEFRRQGVGKILYERFFEVVRENGRGVVRCVTAPMNKTSIAFHRQMGFQPVMGNAELDSVTYWVNYDGPGEHRVLFEKRI